MERPQQGGGSPSAPRALARWLSNSNPFYVVSAVLVLAGLRMSAGAAAGAASTAAVVAGLAGYTLLLAATAGVLVRLGNVWEDVRTLLLLVVLSFVGISVIFDDILARDPRLGLLCNVGGLAFASGLSEALLRGMRLKLPALFRGPYHLILALFFGYPLVLRALAADSGSPALLWALFGFSPAAGLVFLTLLPAVRRGPGYVAKNGSPWRWPMYPWALFVMLALGVVARAYTSCLSANYAGGPGQYVGIYSSIFGPYFLVPFLFALDVLLLEVGRGIGHRGVQRLAVVAPLGLVALAMVGHRADPVYARFLATFAATLGAAPPFLTLLGVVAFALAAWMRGVPHARSTFCAALAALVVVGPGTLDVHGLVAARPLPLAVLGLVLLEPAWRRRESFRALVASACLVAAGSAALPAGWSATARHVVEGHLVLLAALGLGAAFDDALARRARDVAAAGLAFFGLVALAGGPGRIGGVAEAWRVAYPVGSIALAVAYGKAVGGRRFFWAAGFEAACWAVLAGSPGYRWLRAFVPGLDQIALGLTSFAAALLVSLGKAGVLPWRRWWRWVVGPGPSPSC